MEKYRLTDEEIDNLKVNGALTLEIKKKYKPANWLYAFISQFQLAKLAPVLKENEQLKAQIGRQENRFWAEVEEYGKVITKLDARIKELEGQVGSTPTMSSMILRQSLKGKE